MNENDENGLVNQFFFSFVLFFIFFLNVGGIKIQSTTINKAV